jgi:hypothetical protein
VWPAVLEELCRRCRAGGVRISPRWADWHDRCSAAQAAWITEHCSLTGFFDSPAWRTLAATTPSEPEPPACRECGSSGYVPTPAGRDLLAFLRRQLAREVTP